MWLTLQPLPEQQLQQLTAGSEVGVAVCHRASTCLQIQDAHCEGRQTMALRFHTIWTDSVTGETPQTIYAGKKYKLKQEAVVCGAGITLRVKAFLFRIFTFEGAEQRVLWCHIEAQRCDQILSAITAPGVVILPWHGPITRQHRLMVNTWLT